LRAFSRTCGIFENGKPFYCQILSRVSSATAARPSSTCSAAYFVAKVFNSFAAVFLSFQASAAGSDHSGVTRIAGFRLWLCGHSTNKSHTEKIQWRLLSP
jgi:hypothetical protein